MNNIDNFMKDGKVKRSKIALAIAKGDLKRDDVYEFCKNPNVKAAFIGASYPNKCSKDKWDGDYLNEIVCASAAESFNEDYLLYLCDVSETVIKNKNSKKTLKIIIGGAILLLAVVAIAIMVKNKQQKNRQQSAFIIKNNCWDCITIDSYDFCVMIKRNKPLLKESENI